MRRVERNLTQKPAILTQQATLDAWAELLRTGDTSTIRESYYQGPYKDTEGKSQMRVRDELNKYYHGKCAYCETDCKAEVEHYRPKKRVAEDSAHSGYYWLCYEWSNLLPSCHDCNTAGGKGNQFPVAGIRLSALPKLPDGSPDLTAFLPTSAALAAEKPFLLHPEIDNPDQFLGVEPDPKGEGIRLIGLDGSNGRGDQTIRITNLNRVSLKISRLRTLNSFIDGIRLIYSLYATGVLAKEKVETALTILFEQMDQNVADVHQQHSIVCRQAVADSNQFSSIVLPLLEAEIHASAQAAFAAYRLKNPR